MVHITFFGKKEQEPESIALADLCRIADSIFENGLGNLGSRAQSELEGVKNAAEEFTEACDRFQDIDAEPYVQDLWMPNINALKSQKVNYAKALKHALEKMDLNPKNAANAYDKYGAILSGIDKATNELLAVNANFKTVMYCFSKHLSGVKRAFSSLERHRESLRAELTKRSPAAAQYSKVTGRILALNALIEESKTLREGAAALGKSMTGGDATSIAEEESKVSHSISSKNSDLSSIDAELSRLSREISSLTLPLERPSRKYDHMSVRKRPLHPMVVNPEEGIRTDAEYSEFINLVKELRDSIEKDAIEVKNKPGTLSTISRLLDSGMYAMIESTRSLRKKRSDVEREISSMEGALVDVRKGKRSAVEAKEEIKRMEAKAAETEKSIGPARESVEAMFLEYYKRKIKIVL